jgi:hypothetical protein
MKKILFILIAILAIACLSQQTYAYTFTEHDNALASDSPYAVTYTETVFSGQYNKIKLKLAPTSGYNFFGSYVMTIFNLYDDERLAPFDMLVQNGWIGEFPNQIPNYESAYVVELFTSANQLKQRIDIASYQGDPSLVMLRFNFLASETDYYVITLYLDVEENTSDFITHIMSNASGKMIRLSSVTQEEYNRIYAEGYLDAQNEITSNYDSLIQSILEYQQYIALLEAQLDATPTPGGETVSSSDFIEQNIIYFLLGGIMVFALGMYVGQKKKRYKRYR